MKSETLPSPGVPTLLRCPKCSSTDIRRSMPRNGRERLLRRILPIRPFFCRTCEQRTWIWGSYGVSTRASRAGVPRRGRGLEARDRALARRTRGRLVRSAFLALLLGAIFGVYFMHCQEQRHLAEESASGQEGAP